MLLKSEAAYWHALSRLTWRSNKGIRLPAVGTSTDKNNHFSLCTNTAGRASGNITIPHPWHWESDCTNCTNLCYELIGYTVIKQKIMLYSLYLCYFFEICLIPSVSYSNSCCRAVSRAIYWSSRKLRTLFMYDTYNLLSTAMILFAKFQTPQKFPDIACPMNERQKLTTENIYVIVGKTLKLLRTLRKVRYVTELSAIVSKNINDIAFAHPWLNCP